MKSVIQIFSSKVVYTACLSSRPWQELCKEGLKVIVCDFVLQQDCSQHQGKEVGRNYHPGFEISNLTTKLLQLQIQEPSLLEGFNTWINNRDISW